MRQDHRTKFCAAFALPAVIFVAASPLIAAEADKRQTLVEEQRGFRQTNALTQLSEHREPAVFSTKSNKGKAVVARRTASAEPRRATTDLVSGVPVQFQLPSVSAPALFNDRPYRIAVPPGATRLKVELRTTTPGVDVDLHVRYEEVPRANGRVIADYSSESLTGNETITVTPASTPPLIAGDYFITLALHTTGVTATGTVSASYTMGPVGDLEIYNGAGYQKDFVSPGVIATIVAPRLAPNMTGCAVPEWSFGPLPYTLDGVSVTFGGLSAPIYSVCPGAGGASVTVQVPFELSSGITVPARITAPGYDETIQVELLVVSPGVFETTRMDGRLQAVLLRPDDTFVTAQNPARRGETIRVFVTGLGPLVPSVATNQPGGGEGDAMVLHPVIIGVNDAGVPVMYARYADNLVGVWEVAFEVPLNTLSGGDVNFAVAVNLNGLVFGNSSVIPIQ